MVATNSELPLKIVHRRQFAPYGGVDGVNDTVSPFTIYPFADFARGGAWKRSAAGTQLGRLRARD